MIIAKFEEQVAKHANKLAVVTENRKLTYAELDGYAEKAAYEILKLKNKKEEQQVVGLLFEHSADMIVGVLGALKAGEIYVPLDISYPENRLLYMLENSGTFLVLTNNKNKTAAEALALKMKNGLHILNIDELNISAGENKRNPAVAKGDKLAYILYTSGSTGRPKGVVQNHENVCYYIRNWTERFAITHRDRMTLFSAFSHDGAGQDMFGALLNGATIYPYNLLNRTDIAELAQWLITEEITIWHSVPTLYRYFVNTLKNKNIGGQHFPHLRFILLGGEQVRNHDIDMFKTFFSNAIFANVYGQTESSVSSIWKVSVGDTVNKMLIGDPLDKTKILLANEDGEMIEDLGVGEIYTACSHLALRYWQDEEKSAEVFSQHPELGRLYRTGDSGRLMADGSIEFMGRKDAQVKIRGFRIETGEIESILLRYETIKEVVVTAKTDKNGSDHLCAYIVSQPSLAGSTPFTVPEVRKYLAVELPEHMIPSYFVELDQLPLTPNGKVDRMKLPDPEPIRPQLGVTYVAPETGIEEKISAAWKEVLNFDMVGIDDNFFDLGGTSMDIIQVMGRLHDVFHIDIPVVTLFRYPTIRSLARYLIQEMQVEGAADDENRIEGIVGSEKVEKIQESAEATEIAVIGMAGRFPGARNIDQYWENLVNGVGSISFFTKEELAADGTDWEWLNLPNFVRARGIIQDVEYFDASFFNYTPSEAEIMDPQLRILHECCWEALENAGCNPEAYEGSIGFYAGNGANQYWTTLIFLNNISTADAGFLTSNYTTVVSYKLNLKGPSIIVQSACSTSLVAIHLASRALRAHECDIALAGGINIWFPNKGGYFYEEGIMYSRDGYCRPFDAKANGTVFSNGAGIVALKRLEDAFADRDTIYAVIKGSGVNNDGRRKVGLASPSIDGQAEIIRKVYQETGIDPKSISYIEAHGTATLLGDPVEIAALKLVFDSFNKGERGYCRIGSVKSNIGHLSIAAGAAGFIKTVLSLNHHQIPPTLHFETPNPRIDFENSPFIVNDRLTEWKSSAGPLRAAVSAFGIGGTNAHVILEEAPVMEPSSESRPLKMLLLSASSKPALEKITENLGHYLQANPGINLADVAYTLQVGRKAGKVRKMLLCSSTAEAVKLLLEPSAAPAPETGKPQSVGSEEDNRPLVFMFSGQGAQYVNMGLGLYLSEPVFRDTMDRCFNILESIKGFNIKEILYPGTPDKEDPEHINRTEITQPVIFAVEYSLAVMLMKWGFKPHAMIGHSIGEYVAACLSGVLSLEDALSLISLRGKLMQQLPGGSMLSVPLSEEKTMALLKDYPELSLAAVNTTAYCVVSGTHGAIDAFEKQLAGQGINCRRLHTSHAFHSAMMDAMLEEFAQKTREVPLNNPVIPYISNVTGKWITVEEATNPGYWAKHVRSAVRFADGLTELFKEPGTVFLEVGPGRTLNTFVNQHKNKKPDQLNLNLIRHPNENVSDTYFLLSKIGRLWLNGKKIAWQEFYAGEQRRRISLPTYPFQRQPYWLPGNPFKIGEGSSANEPVLRKKTDIADWFYIPAWKSSLLPIPKVTPDVKAEPLYWLLFLDECGVGKRLMQRLQEMGHDVAAVIPGTGFNHPGNNGGYDEYTVSPGSGDDYRSLLQERRALGKAPNRIVHLWNVGDTGNDWQRVQELGFYSLVYLAQALGQRQAKEKVRLTVVSDGMQGAAGYGMLYPQKATITGAVQVIPREYPDITCSSVDIVLPKPETENGEEKLISFLAAELLSDNDADTVAYRYNQRWLKTYEPFPLQPPGSEIPRLKKEGVYLITGGLGGIGLVLAEHLAKTLNAKLALTGRTSLPDREGWHEWLTTHDPQDNMSRKIREVQHLESLGAEIQLINADIIDKEQMQKGILAVEKRFGKINGVIHSAGVPDGGLIQLRTREMSEKVLAPKVQGTLILADLLKDNPLDFFILCSSISAVTAPLGQVAYCAANNFLDHFAYYKTTRDHIFTVSINWDAWREVGMAVDAIKQASKTTSAANKIIEVHHPLFAHCESVGPDQAAYISYLKPTKDWVLSEHLIQGRPALPGTGYLEMARAAVEHAQQIRRGQQAGGKDGNDIIELKEFLSIGPLMVGENEEKELRLILKKEKGETNDYTFSFISRVIHGQDGWLEHARGKASVSTVLAEKGKPAVIEEIKSACSGREIIYNPEQFNGQQGALSFGPRWNNLRWINAGAKQALAFLELPEAFMEDTPIYKLHPALLDVGNAVLRRIYSDGNAYLPIYYKKVEIKKELPPKVFFHVRDADDNKPGAEALKYDITIMDEQGFELVDIREYTLKKVKVESHGVQELHEQDKPSAGLPKQDERSRPYSFYISSGEDSAAAGTADDILKDAITPAEGIEVFMRILGTAGMAEANALTALTQAAVATTDLAIRMKRDTGDAGPSKKKRGQQLQENRPAAIKHARPALSNDYEAPRTEVEKRLAPIWQELLGIEEVGIYDDFFELGGDSLKAVNFGSRIHKELNTEVPIPEFFNRPNIKQLAEYIEENNPDITTGSFQAIPAAEEKEYYPLSTIQRRLYILNRLEETNLAYNLPDTELIETGLDVEIVNDIFKKIIQRHEILRTSFHMIQGEPMQQIHKPDEVTLEVEYHDCSGETPDARISAFVRPFDLAQAPLMRAGVIKIAETACLLLVDFHHIVCDGVSYPILFREFSAAYEGTQLPTLGIQYKDYAVWKNLQDQTMVIEKQKEFWLKAFPVEPPVLNLPLDFPRSTIQEFAGNNLTFAVEKKETQALRELTKEEGVTPYILFLATLNILLMKLSGQEDIVVGTPVAGRRHADLEPLIGVFVNTLALRNYPTPEKTFRMFLKELKVSTLNAFENQDYPFEDLVDKVVVDRDLSHTPLFDVMFILHNELSVIRSEEYSSENLQLRPYRYRRVTSQFDLTFNCYEGNEQFFFDIEYATKLFRLESIQRFMDYLKQIMTSVLTDPALPLANIEIMTPGEKHRVLEEFNNTAAEYPEDKTIHELFTDQAAKTPDHIAVIGEPDQAVMSDRSDPVSLTYRQLNEQSNRLAGLLSEKGVLANHIVCIMVERSVHMMVGLLGILKAGGAYLPLDPQYPEARITYILQHSKAPVLLTQKNIIEQYPDVALTFQGEIIDMFADIPAKCDRGPGHAAGALDTAYVIYTSGSTGAPKGVMVRHRNAINFITGMTSIIPFTAGKTILAVTTISFDIFLLETLLPVTRGMTVAVANEARQQDPRLLADFIVNREIDMVQLTPSRLQLLANVQEDLSCLAGVTELLVGGEAFPPNLWAKVKEVFTGNLYNVYGPTETTVWSTVKDFSRAGSSPDLTIGKPIANTRVYIVDKNMQVQPLGVPGELLIGGAGVAAGYLNNDRLTTEKFLDSPFVQGDRLYRTGDLARRLQDGEIDFLGRMDQQVKIRGFRIELEEIEEQLLQREDIKEALVMSRNGHNGDKYLAAYIIYTHIAPEPGVSELREYLARRLPEYMIPAYFIALEKLPLTPNGKIDRKALPDPGQDRPALKDEFVEPGSQLEITIANLWKEVLKLEKVGIDDNFFELGGNSLALVSLNSRLREVLAKDIAVVAMFRYRTIRSFVNYLTREDTPDERRDRSEALQKGEARKKMKLQMKRK